MSSEWVIRTGESTWTEGKAVAAFIDAETPFKDKSYAKIRASYDSIVRVTTLLEAECRNLMTASKKPDFEAVHGLRAQAVLTVLSHTFEVAKEFSAFDATCLRVAEGTAKHTDLEDTLTEHAANLLSMGYIAQFVAAGMAAGFDALDFEHEHCAKSSQRLGALSEQLTLALSRNTLFAILAATTGE